jgi:hypothetical protein
MSPSRQSERRGWVKRLWGVGLPAPHIAFVLGLNPIEVDAHLAHWGHGVRVALVWRPILAQTSTKVDRLRELGYDAPRIALILHLEPRLVRSYLDRTAPDRKGALSRPRSHREQRQLDRNRRRQIKRAEAAADRAAWKRRRESTDDAGHTEVPALDPPAAAELPPAPEPTRWDGPADVHRAFGTANGRAKLSWPMVWEIRRLHSEGMSCAELGRGFGVSRHTITAVVKMRTWVEGVGPVDSAEASPPTIAPPAAAPRPRAKRRRRWKPGPNEPKLGARGSGSLHDDS